MFRKSDYSKHLLADGAPDDEYESEIEQIVDALPESKEEIEIAKAIQDTFECSFGRDYVFNHCYSIAKNIWEKLYE